MSDTDSQDPRIEYTGQPDIVEEFEDRTMTCSECSDEFTWTAGEQAFFRAKELQNPPKRCKPCKKAKNRRIEAVQKAKVEGKRSKVEVNAECAECGVISSVPFFPSQGRPVYCRDCFTRQKTEIAAKANG